MPNRIQHKRSTSGGATPTLTAGEIGINLTDKRIFTANDTVVFDAFQNTTSSIAISNATGGVLFVGNATYNTVINATHIAIANSTNSVAFTSPTTVQKGGNYYLKADGTWATVSASASPGGSNTHVQFNDSTTLGGQAGFTFDKSTNNAVIANTLTVNNLVVNETLSINTDTFFIGNSTVNAVVNSTSLKISNSTVNAFLTIPTSGQWTATNYFLHANGSWVLVSAGGGTPGGGAADIQYGNNSAFAGNSGFQFVYTTNNVTLANTLTVGSTTVVNSTYVGMGTGFQANTTALNPTANTILLGNSIGRWVVTANSVATQGIAANATALNPTANTILLGNSIGRWVISANTVDATGNLTTTGNVNAAIGYFTGLVNAASHTVGTSAVVNSTALSVTVGGNTVTATGTGLTVSNSTGNTVTLSAPTTTEKAENRYLKVDGTWATVSASAAAGGSNTHVQYNDSTVIGGSAGFTFDESTNNVYIANTLTVDGALIVNSDSLGFGNSTVNTVISATELRVSDSTGITYLDHEGITIQCHGPNNVTVPLEANSYTLFSKYKAGRSIPITMGSSGWDTPLNPHFAHNSVHYLFPNPGATTTTSLCRMVSANTVAFTARTPTSANVFMMQPRNSQTTGATAGTSTSWRNTILSFWRGNGAGLGGFYAVCRFGVAVGVAQGRCFVGFKDSATILSNGNPSAQTNIIGFGWDSAVTNVCAFSANSTVCNTINFSTGTFSTSVGNTDWYEATIFARPNGGTVSYQCTNLRTGDHIFGDYNQTNLPSNTTFLTWQFWNNNGSTAGAQIMDWGGVFIELPY